MPSTNEFGQPVGDLVPDWKGCPPPEDIVLTGRTCRIERLNAAKHADDLFEAYSHSDPRDFTYTTAGLIETLDEYREYAKKIASLSDPRHYAVIDLVTNKPVGTIALFRTDADHGVIEVGYVRFSALMKRSVQSTEAQYLLMSHVFDELGYRRYEWTCDIFNEPSRNAALRLGFTFEGIFRKYKVMHGRDYDIAFLSITNDQWPAIKRGFQAWLAPENFNEQGQQGPRILYLLAVGLSRCQRRKAVLMTQVSYIIPYQSDNETRCFVALDCNDMEKSGAADFHKITTSPCLKRHQASLW